jgi:hypothetical protein
MAVAGQIVTFAERVAHEVWIEEAGNRDGLGGGWETKKLWKPLKMTDNLGCKNTSGTRQYGLLKRFEIRT